MITPFVLASLSILSSLTIFFFGDQVIKRRVLKRNLSTIKPPSLQVVTSKPKKFVIPERLKEIFLSSWRTRVMQLTNASESEKKLLRRAGVYDQTIVSFYKLIKVCSSFVMAAFLSLTIFAYFPNINFLLVPVIFFVFSVFGYKTVDIYFGVRAKERLEEANRFFADYLQLLVISISAGMSMEASLRRVSQQIKRQSLVLHQETELLLAELSLRGDRAIGFSNFADRLKAEHFRNLAVVMEQTEKQGVSAVQALKTLGDAQFAERMSAIEAKVSRLGVLMTVPLILFIFPILFGVIIIPTLIL